MPIVRDHARRLATIETITALDPIPEADLIEQATIRGWRVVVKKGEFIPGDRVLYVEVDTALPLDDPQFEFLAARGGKEVEGRRFHVLKTAKLRGVYSQGLAVPVPKRFAGLAAGTDVTADLDLGVFEPPLPVGSGEEAGPFTGKYARKTDSDRVQNFDAATWAAIQAVEWYATEKIDGTSCTVVRDEGGTLRVNGRNFEIRDGDNTYWNVVRKYAALFAVLEPGDAIQCEIAGPGVQSNPLALGDVRPFVFDVVRMGRLIPRAQWPAAALRWAVPELDLPLPTTPDEAIAQADGRQTAAGAKGRLAEGIVWHTVTGDGLPELDGRATWKVVSNRYLLKHDR